MMTMNGFASFLSQRLASMEGTTSGRTSDVLGSLGQREETLESNFSPRDNQPSPVSSLKLVLAPGGGWRVSNMVTSSREKRESCFQQDSGHKKGPRSLRLVLAPEGGWRVSNMVTSSREKRKSCFQQGSGHKKGPRRLRLVLAKEGGWRVSNMGTDPAERKESIFQQDRGYKKGTRIREGIRCRQCLEEMATREARRLHTCNSLLDKASRLPCDMVEVSRQKRSLQEAVVIQKKQQEAVTDQRKKPKSSRKERLQLKCSQCLEELVTREAGRLHTCYSLRDREIPTVGHRPTTFSKSFRRGTVKYS